MAAESKRGATLRSVAEAAGVSVTTVSHAFSGKGRVAPETKERILAIAARLGYDPSATTTRARRRRAKTLGLTVSPIHGFGLHPMLLEFYRLFIDTATWEALSRDYVLVVVPPADGTIWRRLPIAGAIVMDPRIGDPSLAVLHQTGVPTVTFARELDDLGFDTWVDCDNVSATRAILDHFANQGATSIALITPPPVTSYVLDCLGAYRTSCDERGVQASVAVVEHATEQAAARVMRSLLLSERPPDAVFATIDPLGAGALRAADELGVAVPRDVLLATCSESDLLRHDRPFLTRFSVKPEECARHAVRMLVDLAEDAATEARHVLLQPELFLYGSSQRQPPA